MKITAFLSNESRRALFLAMIFVTGFGAGLVAHLVSSVFDAQNRTAAESVWKGYDVKIIYTSPNDDWLKDLDIHYFPIDKIRTDGQYGILVLYSKNNQFNKSPTFGCNVTYFLGGFSDGIVKPVTISNQYFSQHPSCPQVILIDLISASAIPQPGRPLTLKYSDVLK